MNIVTEETNLLMKSQVALMENWKWIALTIAIIAGFLLHSILRNFIVGLKKRPLLLQNSNSFIRKLSNTSIEKPLSWLGACIFWGLSLEGINPHPLIDKYLTLLIKVGFAFFTIILIYRAVEAIGELLIDVSKKTTNPLDDQLAPMATKILKILVLIFGVLISLDNFGIKVTPMLAGLGIGSLAFALAAQDTAANFFGSITIVADRPFQLGDWIKVGDTEGLVEDIGFRSTRVRTFYNSLVTIPNSIMAKERIDNLGVRKFIRIRHTLGFTYETQIHQLQHFMSLVEEYLESHAKIQKENYGVYLIALGDFSQQVQVTFHASCTNGDEERELQQEFLFFCLDLSQKLGINFAYPTTTQFTKNL